METCDCTIYHFVNRNRNKVIVHRTMHSILFITVLGPVELWMLSIHDEQCNRFDTNLESSRDQPSFQSKKQKTRILWTHTQGTFLRNF